MRAPVSLGLAAAFGGLLLLPATASAAPGERVWHPHVRAAKAYARSREGNITFAVRTRGRLAGLRVDQAMPSASVVKAMLLVAYLNNGDVRGRELSGADRALIGPMIRRSKNRAANRVHAIVGSAGLYAVARRAGMRNFSTTSLWSGTQVTGADQTRLFLNFERQVPARHRDTARRLLGSVVGYQRWGIARVRPPGWALYFKGGWTPRVQAQVGLYRRGRRRIAVAVLTSESPGPLYGRETERGIASRLLRGLGRDSRLR